VDETSSRWFRRLLASPSPSGYEQPVQEVVRDYVGGFASAVSTDWHGNVVAAVNPGGWPRVMIAGHCDQIGLMVKHVDENGFVWGDAIGSWDAPMLIGQTVQVWGGAGPVSGVMARKPVHLLKPDERMQVPEIKDLWIDIGTTSRKETLEVLAIGDPVTFELGIRELRNEMVFGAGMDNKAGLWVVMNALRQVADMRPKAAVFSVSTVHEEIGLRGATARSASRHMSDSLWTSLTRPITRRSTRSITAT
jgi:putative aminopeptidase FrvX